ncbi:MAG: class I SAM-dependent methyltransferase [Candidatus Xenobia bacterium]
MNPIAQHYTSESLMGRVASAMAMPEPVSPLLLAPLDQFHMGGLTTTIRLAEFARVRPGESVLDVGSGLGGAARVLATLAGAQVVGLDVTPAYCDAANELARRCGLQDRLRYQLGDALHLPFPDGSFEVVWSQHVSMNIADRRQLYAEMYRVLKPGGRVALHDVVSVGGCQPRFPVPWAETEANSHLLTVEAMREHLQAAGFNDPLFHDATPMTLAQVAHPVSPVGFQSVTPPGFQEMARNIRHSLEEGAVALAMVVAIRD